MADLSDVTAYLASTIAAIVYPSGTTGASIINGPVKIFEGWPLPDVLDLDMQGKFLSVATASVPAEPIDNGVGPVCSVSVFPVPGGTKAAFQILDNPYVITAPVHGLTPTVSGVALTLAGTPGTGEFVTIIADGSKIYSRGGADIATILAALLADMATDYPSAAVASDTITVNGASEIIARIGAPATLGQVTHRQEASVQITIWAPDPARRTALSAPIAVALSKQIVVTLADGSMAKITPERVNVTDDHQTVSIYRRDLVFAVEYATVETFEAVEITAVAQTVDATGSNPGAPTVVTAA